MAPEIIQADEPVLDDQASGRALGVEAERRRLEGRPLERDDRPDVQRGGYSPGDGRDDLDRPAGLGVLPDLAGNPGNAPDLLDIDGQARRREIQPRGPGPQ